MKFFLFPILYLCTFCFFSCSNDNTLSDLEIETKATSLSDKNIIVANSIEDVFEKTNLPNIDQDYILNTPLPRLNLTAYKAYGYDTRTKYHTTKMMFGGPLAEELGLSSTNVYIVEFYNVYKDVSIAEGTKFLGDDECTTVGCVPTDKKDTLSYKKGYASMPKDKYRQTLLTQCFCVVSNMLGQKINKWYPGNPQNYEWSYYCLQM